MEERELRTDVPAARLHTRLGLIQVTVASFAAIFSFFGCIFREEYTVFGTGFYMFVFLFPPGIFGYMAGTRDSQWHLARAFSLSVIASVACLMGITLCVIEFTFIVPQYALYVNSFYMAVLRITDAAGQYQIAKVALLLLGCIIGGIASIIQTVIAWRDLVDPSWAKRRQYSPKRFPAPPAHFGRAPEAAVATPAVGGSYRV